MALDDFYSNLHLFLRWLHVLAGLVWIGHLYFFNFVNVPLQGALDDASKKIINPKLLPRALWWFRWGAMVTMLAGLALFTQLYMYTPGQGFGPSALFVSDGVISSRALWIMYGMGLGLIMWFNVWFIIWPAQKSMLQGKVAQEQIAGVRKRALMTSRLNTYLSGPMLFAMLAPNHYGGFNIVTVVTVSALGILVIYFAIQASSKVGTSV